jgi:hypothetical protein
MSAQPTDLLVIERGGTLYKATVSEVAALGGAGGVLKGSSFATLPSGDGLFEWNETIPAFGVSPSSIIFLSLASHENDDENDPEFIDLLSLVGQAGTDEISVTLSFGSKTSGVVKLNWSAF